MNLSLEANPFTINHIYIGHAVEKYTQCQYKYVTVPWTVSEEADAVTRPQHVKALTTKLGNLVGSGEQGFIQLMLDGKIGHGKYQTVTPCFRDEPEVDALHQNSFMKLELIVIGSHMPSLEQCLDRMCIDAQAVLSTYQEVKNVHKRIRPKIVKTDSGFDLVSPILNIELGSYGIRQYKDYAWVYGTGLAEPRYSTATYLEAQIK